MNAAGLIPTYITSKGIEDGCYVVRVYFEDPAGSVLVRRRDDLPAGRWKTVVNFGDCQYDAADFARDINACRWNFEKRREYHLTDLRLLQLAVSYDPSQVKRYLGNGILHRPTI